jgi:hypothetical protein
MSGVLTILGAAMHLAGQFTDLMQLAKEASSLTPEEVQNRASDIMARVYRAEEFEWALVGTQGKPG